MANRDDKKLKPRHGLYGTPVYISWYCMKTRCTNPNAHRWKRYGGRGITLCDRWNDFMNFYRDMGPRPPGTLLDRIDNDGNYCPENCRWEPLDKSARNKSSVKITEKIANDIFKSRDTVDEISKKYKVAKTTVYGIKRGEIWSTAVGNDLINCKRSTRNKKHVSLCGKTNNTVTNWHRVGCVKCLGLRPPEPKTRNNKLVVTAYGETKTIKEWSEIFGVHYHTIKKRLYNGWDHISAVSKPTESRSG